MRLEIEALQRACRNLIGLGNIVQDVAVAAERLKMENNTLRRNNERLTKENAALRRRCGEAESNARTASTIATAYRIEARGGNYDATKEDAP